MIIPNTSETKSQENSNQSSCHIGSPHKPYSTNQDSTTPKYGEPILYTPILYTLKRRVGNIGISVQEELWLEEEETVKGDNANIKDLYKE